MRMKHLKLTLLSLLMPLAFLSSNAVAIQDTLSTIEDGWSSPEAGGGLLGFSDVFRGGAQVRYPHNTVQLISIEPPRMNIGCGGIDVSLGSYSVLSSDEFVNFLENIARTMPAYAVRLGIAMLCPSCERIMADLQDITQQMHQMSLNSCQWSERGYQAARRTTENVRTQMRDQVANDNDAAYADRSAALVGAEDKSTYELLKDIESKPDQERMRALIEDVGLGFDTMMAVRHAENPDQLEFIPALLGGKVQDVDTDENKKESRIKNVQTLPGIISPRALVHLYMYGAHSVRGDQVYFYRCQDEDFNKNPKDTICMTPLITHIRQSQWYINGSAGDKVEFAPQGPEYEFLRKHHEHLYRIGYFGVVYGTLYQAIRNIYEGKPLQTAIAVELPPNEYQAAGNGRMSFKSALSDKDIIDFVRTAPMDLMNLLTYAKYDFKHAVTLAERAAHRIALHYAKQDITANLLESGFSKLYIPAEVLESMNKKIGEVNQAITTIERTFDSVDSVAAQWSTDLNAVLESLYLEAMDKKIIDSMAYSQGMGAATFQ